MGRVTLGILGALTVLSVHTAAWAQQPPPVGPVNPGGAVAGPGFPQGGGPGSWQAGPQEAQPAPGAYPESPPSQPEPPTYPQQSYPQQSYPPQAYGAQPPPPPYPPQGQGYPPSPYPPSYPPPPPPYRPYGYSYGRPGYGGYGYGAPRPYYGYPTAAYVPARSVLDRPFEVRLGLGLSSLRYTDLSGNRIADEAGGNWNLQIGFGLAPRVILLFGVDSVLAGGNDYTYEQTALTVGLQVFLMQRLYLRGGIGAGVRSASSDTEVFTDSTYGEAGLFGVGVELVQGYHWAVQGEWDFIATRFSGDDTAWYSNTFGFGITFF